MNLKERYQKIEEEISDYSALRGVPYPVKLVAVSKGQAVDALREVMIGGCYEFGESRVQEALEKQAALSPSIHWHMIGPLQTNKLPKLIGKFVLIHSVSSLELLQGIDERSKRAGLITNVLLQSNTSGEETKQGLSPEEWEKAWPAIASLQSVKIEGLMTIAPLTDDHQIIRDAFANLRKLQERLQEKAYPHTPLYHLSMGMSHDWRIAIEEGATILRIGNQIFSE
jgi:pyridoxal phosphate enzyme (YggS family)